MRSGFRFDEYAERRSKGFTRGPAMYIRFGEHLDGLQPHAVAVPVGEMVLGPAGLLSVLETQLGLAPRSRIQARRSSAISSACGRCRRPAASSSDPSEVDPVNVARTLLSCRAQWYEAGWNGMFPEAALARLADMAVVEVAVGRRIPRRRPRFLADRSSGRPARVPVLCRVS